MYIGITGLVCNEDRGGALQKLVPRIPLDRLVLGSDAPYLTPFNMKRPFPAKNEPQFMGHILVKIAQLLERDEREVAEITTEVQPLCTCLTG